MRLLLAAIFINSAFAFLSVAAEGAADNVFLNGKVLTMDESGSISESVAVKDGVIIFVGKNCDAEKFIGSGTKVIDLKGRLLMPGFIESHGHFYSTGQSLNILDLVGTASAEEIAGLVRDRAGSLPEGQWIIGRGWDQNDWAITEFPDHSILDIAAPKNPVLLRRVDGHAVWVNGLVLMMAGITEKTKNPDGGEILHDNSGRPTGILIDNAINLINGIVTTPNTEEIINDLVTAEKHCLSLGITSFHDMGISPGKIGILKKLYSERILRIRLYEYIGSDESGWKSESAKGPQIDLFNKRLTIRGVKAFIDGALGSRGALLSAPYSDRPDTRGLQVISDEELTKVAEYCKEQDLQLAVHAIGDLGNHKVLDVYEKVIGKDSTGKRRWRIEHAQILAKDDIPRFKKYGVVPSMQPVHCTSDMPWATDRIGEQRIAGAYAWRSLLDTGAIIPGGSDTPVEDANPILGIYAAVTRQDIKGNPPGGWHPEQRVSRDEAIKMFTSWGAWAAFEENYKGSIKPGYIADLIVLDRDISNCAPEDIPVAKVVMTFLNGELVYSIQEK
jgi:predicted amidohydrolase YtcJ